METMSSEQVARIYDGKAQTWKWNGVVDTLIGVSRLRRSHFASAEGDVLDIGCGTGENLKYLANARSITAIDISQEMVTRTARRSERLGLGADVRIGDAAALPFSDDSFDTVVSAMSTCTFTEYVEAFAEMARVARRGGRILLLEHGRSNVRWIGARQDRNFEKNYAGYACRTNRDPRSELAEAGLTPVDHRVSHLGMIHRFAIAVD